MTRIKIVQRTAVVATAVFASVVVFTGAVMAIGDDGPIGPRPRGMGGRGDHHRGGALLIAVALVLATALITWFIARRRNAAAAAPRSGNAEAILSERLARSEISVDDYRTTLAALRETSSS
jgi:uncharacterized membrane protein